MSAESESHQQGAPTLSRRRLGGIGLTLVKAVVAAEVAVPLMAFGIDRWKQGHPTQAVEAGQGGELLVQGNAGWAKDATVQFGVSMVRSNDPANPYFVAQGEPQRMKIIRVNPIYGDAFPNGDKVPMNTYDVFATEEQVAALAHNPQLTSLTSATDGTPFRVRGRQQTAQYTYTGEDGNPVTVFTTQSLVLEKAVPYTPPTQ